MIKSTMREREVEQATVFKLLEAGNISQIDAARTLDISTRWVRKKIKRYQKDGIDGLSHGNRGRPSKRKLSKETRDAALEWLNRPKWHDFGPKFASEKLAEQGVIISRETTRQIMIQEGLWDPVREDHPVHRKRRIRREQFGAMTQLDGSAHSWFEERGDTATLLVFVDDATSKLLWLEFAPTESHLAVSNATINYFKTYGRPLALYTDHGSVFDVNGTSDESSKTTFETAMEQLNITLIHANSPQAKGRVERANKTLQDRLIKELRLRNISTIEDANRYVREIFIQMYNDKFAVVAQMSGDVHRPLPADFDREELFAQKSIRLVKKDYTVEFETRVFQILDRQKVLVRPGSKIMVYRALKRNIMLKYNGVFLKYEEIFVPSKVQKLVPIRRRELTGPPAIISFMKNRELPTSRSSDQLYLPQKRN